MNNQRYTHVYIHVLYTCLYTCIWTCGKTFKWCYIGLYMYPRCSLQAIGSNPTERPRDSISWNDCMKGGAKSYTMYVYLQHVEEPPTSRSYLQNHACISICGTWKFLRGKNFAYFCKFSFIPRISFADVTPCLHHYGKKRKKALKLTTTWNFITFSWKFF